MAASGKLCQGIDCQNPAKLQCPTCLKLNIEDSYFCSQECFKKNWPTHKSVHKSVLQETTNPWPGHHYTGKLRPHYPLSPKRELPEHIKRPDYADKADGAPGYGPGGWASTKIAPLTDPSDIEKMRTVCRLAREVLDIAGRAVRPGITTDEIDKIVHEACIERNAYPSPLNYHRFPKSCCTSINEVICHGIPDRRPLEDGDIINIDVTLYHDGFHGDLNETYFVGNVDEKGKKLVKVTMECLEKAIAIAKPGTLYRDIGGVIDKHARSNGFSVVRTYCGHGINQFFHCAPNVPHYAKNKAVGVMKPGHTFTIEPMISEGVWQDEQWPDEWTAVTADGKRSAQFEQTLLITETGCEILTRRLADSPYSVPSTLQ
ncbi:methionine aminopeptidase [Basidiobolus meristosporus CBS 931.73]|uniref:Methionine aminopeptidase n=1 Tax=Basidiobolus meristosporus CBS 931.73 TaxID=1314790 RepID=A0A1Y1WW31_9FUNG|nr:methionine aminopeptidase [Basidiobolus meristosporus CBS 931.73]|eukprot:ORX77518.1 methionine aminopeptidase [Basidiobolus meristosporus CBS 931.73]